MSEYARSCNHTFMRIMHEGESLHGGLQYLTCLLARSDGLAHAGSDDDDEEELPHKRAIEIASSLATKKTRLKLLEEVGAQRELGFV